MAQRITTIIEVIDKATGKIRRTAKEVEMMGTRMKEMETQAGDTARTYDKSARRWRDSSGQFVASTKKITRATEGMTRRFQFHYLSILFFGMAIQRVFQGIMRSTTQAYLKMTEGQTEAGQALLALSSGFAFLSFSVGEAIGRFLQPFVPTLLSIIDSTSDWVSQNKELTGSFVLVGLAAGTLLLTIGVMKLGMMGLTMWIEAATLRMWWWKFSNSAMILSLAKLKAAVVAFAATAIGSLALVAAAIVGLYLIWENNILGIKDSTYEILRPVADFLITLAQTLLTVWRGIQNIGYYLGVVAQDAISTTTEAIALLEAARGALYTPDFKEWMLKQRPLTGAIGTAMREVQSIFIQELNINAGDREFDEIMDDIKKHTNVTVGT